LDRLEALALTRPSAVQAASFDKISSGNDTIVGGETGSGKTLAYLLPLLDNILTSKQEGVEYDYAKAIILVPNKELVNQVVRMACDLCGGRANSLVWGTSGGGVDFRDSLEVAAKGDTETNDVDPKDIVRIGVMPGGLGTPNDYKPFRSAIGLGGSDAPIDLVITTPASLGPLALSPKNIDMFADVETLVIDEADMLLDGGYIRQLDNVLMGFRRADRLDDSYGVRKTQHVFVAATLPDMGLKSVDAYMNRRFPHAERITMAGMHNARHYGLREQTKWIADTGMGNKGRLELVVEMLTNPDHSDSLIGEKVMIFLNSVQDVDGATNALRYVFLQHHKHSALKIALIHKHLFPIFMFHFFYFTSNL
jgi:superfamily II DNA/RNA helicase